MRIFLLLLCACDAVWSLEAKVTTPDGAPVARASLAITCPDWTGQAALTDANGVGKVGALGWQFPAHCTVTVASPGHAPYTTSFEDICKPQSLDDCWRIKHIDVVLASPR